MGAAEVPDKVLWGVQTQRALDSGIAAGTMPWELLEALVLAKKAPFSARWPTSRPSSAGS